MRAEEERQGEPVVVPTEVLEGLEAVRQSGRTWWNVPTSYLDPVHGLPAVRALGRGEPG